MARAAPAMKAWMLARAAPGHADRCMLLRELNVGKLASKADSR